MAYSNQTPNYGLPLPLGTDKSNFMDTNTAFAAVDTALKGAVDGVAALSGTTGGISEALTGLTNRVDGIDTDITQLKNADGTIVGNFGTVETGQVSAHDYAAGDMFVWLNVIRKATVAIHVGDQLVNGTNCVIVSLDEIIGNLNVINEIGSISDALLREHWTKVAEVTGNGNNTWQSMLNSIFTLIDPYLTEDKDLFLDYIDTSGNHKQYRLIRSNQGAFVDFGLGLIYTNDYGVEQIEIRSTGSEWKVMHIAFATSAINVVNFHENISTTDATLRVFAHTI